MKIGIQTWGSAGDTRPALALGGELAARGHHVTAVVTPVDNRDYTNLAANLGIELRTLKSPFSSRTEMTAMAPAIMGRTMEYAQYRATLELMLFSVEKEMTEAALRLAAENDVLIGHLLVYPLGAAAAKLGKPYITHTLSDIAIPSAAYPPYNLHVVPAFFNRTAWRIADFAASQLFLKRINRLRAELGVPPAKSFLREAVTSPLLNIVSASAALCPPQADWTGRHEVCGFFPVPHEKTDLPLAPAITEFIQAGPAPVFMGFGSMSDFDPDTKTLESVFTEAAAKAGVRAIIQLPHREPELKGNVLIIGSAEHRAIAPHCMAMVHHGGAGTTHTALLCGVPQIIVSHLADQPYWGRIIHAKGLGPKHLSRARLTAARLADRIKTVTTTPDFKTKAAQAAAFAQTEHGTALAADLIERLINGK